MRFVLDIVKLLHILPIVCTPTIPSKKYLDFFNYSYMYFHRNTYIKLCKHKIKLCERVCTWCRLQVSTNWVKKHIDAGTWLLNIIYARKKKRFLFQSYTHEISLILIFIQIKRNTVQVLQIEPDDLMFYWLDKTT